MSASPQVHLRAGVVVPRHRHNAVERNQLKRRLRELVRLHVLPLGIPVDLVIWALRSAYDLSFDQLRVDVEELVPRLRRFDSRRS